MNRVLVIGLDGVDPILLDRIFARDWMPFLGRLAAEGARDRLRTVFPPITAPAWVSFLTGKNPGRHGVSEFLMRTEGAYDLSPVCASTISAPLIWETLSARGIESAFAFVPVTYPIRPFRGAGVSGMLSPARGDVIHPPELGRALLAAVPGFRIYNRLHYAGGPVAPFVEDLIETISAQREAALFLARNRRPDYFMVHFLATDTLSHAIWPEVVESPDPDPSVVRFFRVLDDAIRELVQEMGPSHVIALSDHGMGPVRQYFNLNTWLLREGYIRLRRGPLTLLKSLLFRAGCTPWRVHRALVDLGFGKLLAGLSARPGARYGLMRRLFLSFADIDWARTRAYGAGNFGQLWLNLRGREPQGAVEPGQEADALLSELQGKLRALIDPSTGRPLAADVPRAGDLYQGERMDVMPDLSILPADWASTPLGTADFSDARLFVASHGIRADHRPEGILVLHGAGFQPTRIDGPPPSILDLHPTVLDLFGLPLPADLDGRSLMAGARQLPSALGAAAAPAEVADALTEEEREEVLARLRGLGYA